MRPFAVAGLQVEVRAEESQISEMEVHVEGLIKKFPWVEMVVVSELAVGSQVHAQAEPMPGPTEAAMCRIAEKHHIWFVPGSFYESHGGHIYNTTPVIDPNGNVVGRHRKIFPFTPYEAGISAGTKPLVFDVPDVGRFGVLICYDLWFPETARWLVTQGVEVILHPALTDTIDRDIELAMVRATAAQNQCYVIDVNGLGDGGVGRSLFVGPAGDVLHQAGTHVEEIPFELDLDRVSRGREFGLRGLGQPLKSFRDRACSFDFYQDAAPSDYLSSLGPLVKPERGSRAGLDRPRPRSTPNGAK